MIKDLWAKTSYFWFIIMLIVGGFFFAIDNVFAEVLESWSVNQNRYRFDNRGTLTYSSWVNTPYTWEPNLPVDKVQYRMQATNGLSVENTYILEFGYRPNPDSLGVKTVNIFTNVNGTVYEDITCGNWNKNSNDYYLIKCSFTPKENISSSTYLYAEVNFYQSYQTSFRPYMYGFEERKGINSVVTEQTNKIINGLNDVDDTMKDDTIDDPNTMISDFEDMLPTNGTITQLIGLPITLYTKVLNSINGTCSQFNLGSLYGHNLIMPCIEVSTYLSSGIWSTIDLIISGAFVLIISKKMIKAFENFTSMKEGDVINND